MNLLIAGIGANLTFGVLSSFAATTRGVVDLIGTIKQSGGPDIKKAIDELDLEATLKIIHCMVSEIYVDDQTPGTIIICLKSLMDVIRMIYDELGKINYRLQYNNSLWFGLTFRSYRFINCESRLRTYMIVLENRKKLLIDIINMQNRMFKNQTIFTPEITGACTKNIEMITHDNLKLS